MASWNDPAYAEETAELWLDARIEAPKSALVFFHGLGETEVPWRVRLEDALPVPEVVAPVRRIWPRAEISPCTAWGGTETTQWFDCPELPVCRVVREVPDRDRHDEDSSSVRAGVSRVHAVLKALEAEEVPLDKTLLMGFGQGAGLALHGALRYPRPVAGVLMLSGWVPCPQILASQSTEEGRTAKVLWLHGKKDTVVECAFVEKQAEKVREMGVDIKFEVFDDLGYGVDDREVERMVEWMEQTLDPEGYAAKIAAQKAAEEEALAAYEAALAEANAKEAAAQEAALAEAAAKEAADAAAFEADLAEASAQEAAAAQAAPQATSHDEPAPA